MDFIDVLKQFSVRVGKLYPQIQTEEATKTSLIMPFFQTVFGYDVFNPDEFVPEFVADVGIKKGEKVDYAIMVGGEPAILVEAKWCGESLDKHDSQLFRYFGTTKAKFGILTNGVVYKFYTDLNEQNKMDMSPFLEMDILNIKEPLVPELKRFCKANFDAGEIFSRASELKYSNEIKAYFVEQLREPVDDFVKFMLSQTYEGVKTAAVVEKFRPIVKTSLNSLIGEMMNERITTALKTDATPASDTSSESAVLDGDEGEAADSARNRIVTTDEELQAYYIVKAILASEVDMSQVSYKDTYRYFAVLYGDTPARWVCRLRLTARKKSLILPAESGDDVKHELSGLDDIYGHKEAIIASARRFVADTATVVEDGIITEQ